MLRIPAGLALIVLASPAFAQEKPAKKVQKAGPQIGHMVYFKLKDATPENQQKLVDACKKLLSGQEGIVYFAAGVRGEEYKHPFNDRDWDVGLHLVFVNKAAHDKYQDHPDHLKFIEENKALWSGVRVFDSEFTPLAKKKIVKPAK